MAFGIAGVLAGCGGQGPPAAPAPAATAPPPPGEAAAPAEPTAAALQATSQSWTPEQLEELLAPIALYPDPVLQQVLTASTNPQEVLDAGNWLVANPKLEGKALDEAAERIGFTPPIRALIQFPQVVDQMCQNMSWTEELGQAFVNDQAGTLEAVQRLRAQARDVGNLKTSEQMKVETKEKDGKEVVAISPPSPEVVYVPQYNPTTVYAPPVAAPAAPATTTVVEEKDEGHSTGALITTGLLAFGAGMLVNEVFDDDDDYYGYGWGAPMPYYPPYPYRPAYGGGFYPSNGYNRPNNYVRGSNNNVVVVNQDNNYFSRFDDKAGDRRGRQADSPITRANRSRNDLQALNRDAAQGPKRGAPAAGETWKGKNTYAGAGGAAGAKRSATGTKPTGRAAPKVQGSYAGARPSAGQAATRNVASTRPAAAQRATTGAGADRGYDVGSAGRAQAPSRATPQQRDVARTSAPARQQQSQRSSAFSGARVGGNERAASKRGRQSMSKGGSGRSGGGARRGR
jgi:hypothetical protein